MIVSHVYIRVCIYIHVVIHISWSWWKFIERIIFAGVRERKACFYDLFLLRNYCEVKSCTTRSVHYTVCIRCDYRCASSRCFVETATVQRAKPRLTELGYSCSPWPGLSRCQMTLRYISLGYTFSFVFRCQKCHVVRYLHRIMYSR